VSYDVGCRCGSDLALLWLWCRLTAIALIKTLAWELPYAVSPALKSKKKKIALIKNIKITLHFGNQEISDMNASYS